LQRMFATDDQPLASIMHYLLILFVTFPACLDSNSACLKQLSAFREKRNEF